MEKIEVVNIDRSLDSYSIQELIDLDWKEYLKIANYNKDPYKMCEDCIAEQKRKYGGRTPIICNGLKDYKTALSHQYSDEVLEEIEKHLTPEELSEIKGVYSAPDWFKANIKDERTYSPRFHQDLLLKCSAKHKVIRMGRRCIAEYEEVLLADGSYKQIKDMSVGDMVFSNRDGKLAKNRVLDVIDNGIREVYEVRLASGRTVRVTDDHEILTSEGWKSLKTGLKAKDLVSEIAEIDFAFSEVKEIRKIEGSVRVYDLTVENDHNFITNGIVTHNCGKTFSIILDIIHRIETTDRPLNILVAAPMLTMITEIERTIVTLINATGREGFITAKKSSPTLEVKFFNGSLLQGITLSNDGTSARGKKADILWVDEMDFANRKSLEALQAIEMDNPNVEVVYTSTPIGQGNLYAAEALENTKSFHFPSYVIPHYNDAMHKSMKSSLSDIGFAQECFVGDTEVLTTKGVKAIRDIKVGDEVYYDQSAVVPVIQSARVTGVKEVVEYQTPVGSFICTPDHGFPNRDGVKTEIQYLKEVPVYTDQLRYVPILGSEPKGVQEVYNIGVGSSDHSYLLANGVKTFNCLALYGLDESGVFQIHYIEECVDLYIPQVFNQQTVLTDRGRFIVFIGVDWNHDLNGTRIVVTAYDKNSDKFFVVEKAKIAKQNLTQAIAVDMVVELNRKYQADHIICDEGFGIGQVSELRTRGRNQYGKVPASHPDIKLVDTMSVQFGSSLEIRDPTTHEVLKKNTKQYIVENTQKLLEQRRLTFNDKEDNDLIMQMKNYTVISSGLRGNKYKPKDKKIGDHDLDAFMLCLYGFDYHYGDYIKPKLVEHGVILNQQVQYDVPKGEANLALVGILHKNTSRSIDKGAKGHRKAFKLRKRW